MSLLLMSRLSKIIGLKLWYLTRLYMEMIVVLEFITWIIIFFA